MIGVDCVLLGHNIHVHRRKWICVLFPPNGGIWASGTLAKAAAAAVVGVGAALKFFGVSADCIVDIDGLSGSVVARVFVHTVGF